MSDESKIIKAGLISKAMSGRYLNTRRLLRDLENVEEHFDKGDSGADLRTMLKKFMTTNEKSNDRLDRLEKSLEKVVGAIEVPGS